MSEDGELVEMVELPDHLVRRALGLRHAYITVHRVSCPPCAWRQMLPSAARMNHDEICGRE